VHMILVVDNYDSFTYNLVQYIGESGAEVRVFRNDELSVGEVLDLSPEKIVISPGPGTPEDAGISVDLINAVKGSSSIAWRLPWPPVNRGGTWRQVIRAEHIYAWQNLSRIS